MFNITSITSAVETFFGLQKHHISHPKLDEILKEQPKNVVLIVIDALGEVVLKKHTPTGFFEKHKKDLLNTVVPATTVAANTTLKTGVLPHQHGWLGWSQYFKESDEVVNIFSNTNFDTNEVSKLSRPAGELQVPTLVERIKANGIPAYEVMPAWADNGCKTFDDWCNRLKMLCQKDEKKYIYAYWSELDSALHANGIGSKKVQETVDELEKKLTLLSEELKDTVMIITADHGHHDVEQLYLSNDYPHITKMMAQPNSLEPRCAAFHIKEEYKKEFPLVFKETFQDFHLMTGKAFIRLLGGSEHPFIKDAVGDYVALAKKNRSLTWKFDPEWPMKSEHAGFSKEEMIVPLIIINTLYRDFKENKSSFRAECVVKKEVNCLVNNQNEREI